MITLRQQSVKDLIKTLKEQVPDYDPLALPIPMTDEARMTYFEYIIPRFDAQRAAGTIDNVTTALTIAETVRTMVDQGIVASFSGTLAYMLRNLYQIEFNLDQTDG